MNAVVPGSFRKSAPLARSSLAAHYPGNSFNPPRPIWTALRRGFRGACPACGIGALFHGYLDRHAYCPHCGEALHLEAPGTLPALIAAPAALAAACLLAALLDILVEPPLWVSILFCEALALIVAFRLAPRANGAALGLAWAVWHGKFDPHERTCGVPNLPLAIEESRSAQFHSLGGIDL